MQQPFYASQCQLDRFHTPRFLLRASLLVLPLCLLSSVFLLHGRAGAEEKFAPVRLRIGGKEVVGKIKAISNGKETYVPVEALKAVGIESKTSRSGDAVIVTLPHSTKHKEIALARPKGKGMLPLTAVAELVDGVVLRPEVAAKGEESESSQKGNTVYLLARVTEARFADGALKVTTSFPVPYHSRMEVSPPRGYVDCVGAYISEKFKPLPLPSKDHRALRLRAAQNDTEIARVVVELADGNVLKASDAPANTGRVIVAALDKTNAKGPVALKPASSKPEPTKTASAKPAPAKPASPKTTPSKSAIYGPVQVAQNNAPTPGKVQNPGKIDDVGTSAKPASDSHGKGGQGTQGKVAANTPPKVKVNTPPVTANPRNPIDGPDVSSQQSEKTETSPDVETHLAVRGKPPARGGAVKREVLPIEVRDLTFTPVDEKLCRVELQTSGKAGVSIRYVPGTTTMIMDLANTKLHLPEDDDGERAITHPLLRKITATSVGDDKPVTRLTLDMSRITGFAINTTEDHCTLELRLPRNAYGVLAEKTIVVDAGHGGSATGATGHKGVYTIYEKDVTLAIALKLRTALEACGARVVMTRDHDADVGLDARPGLANGIGADLFISIHNDSNGVLNSASGTSTYYHSGDWSSRAFATCVQNAVMAVTGLPSRGVLSDAVMYASGFAVLRGSKMPAVLCEVAYINNSNDLNKLLDPEFQQRVALAMCDGIRAYIEGKPGTSHSGPMGEMPQPGDPRDEDGKEIPSPPIRNNPAGN